MSAGSADADAAADASAEAAARPRSRSPPGATPTTLRDLLPRDLDLSALWKSKGGFMDRPLNLMEIMDRSQCMAAQMAANKLLQEVLVEMGFVAEKRFLANLEAAEQAGILTRRECADFRRLNHRANAAKYELD